MTKPDTSIIEEGGNCNEKIEGDVTAKEILEAIGTGTFGHRGPSIFGNTFTYTKVTD